MIVKRFFLKAVIFLSMFYIKWRPFRQLQNACKTPDQAQVRALMAIISANKQTSFGKEYNFSSITTIQDYRAATPICEYEFFRPYIDKQLETNEFVLTPERPELYAQTSGTTAEPKYIPILKKTLQSYKRSQRISACAQHSAVDGIFSGKIMAIVSPAIEGYLPNGQAYGSMSGVVYQTMPSFFCSRYVLDAAIFDIKDYETKYRLIAAFSMMEPDISCIATANPSTLIKIIEVINQYFDSLICFTATGHLRDLNLVLEPALKKRLDGQCKANPERAAYLTSVYGKNRRILLSELWPDIRAVLTWTSGNCAVLLPALRQQLSSKTRIIEMGYLASEFKGTIIVDCLENLGVPTLEENFFEFAEVNAWDNGEKDILLLSQLKKDVSYYIIVTAPHGLYRYFINDIVKVTGFYHKTPTLVFVQKGKGVTNMSGEKLYESQVIQAVRSVCEKENIAFNFFIMIADKHAGSYTLYIESINIINKSTLSQAICAALSEINIEFRTKLDSGRIYFKGIEKLKIGTLEAYKKQCIIEGQREGQFKLVKLKYRDEISFAFEAYICP